MGGGVAENTEAAIQLLSYFDDEKRSQMRLGDIHYQVAHDHIETALNYHMTQQLPIVFSSGDEFSTKSYLEVNGTDSTIHAEQMAEVYQTIYDTIVHRARSFTAPAGVTGSKFISVVDLEFSTDFRNINVGYTIGFQASPTALPGCTPSYHVYAGNYGGCQGDQSNAPLNTNGPNEMNIRLNDISCNSYLTYSGPGTIRSQVSSIEFINSNSAPVTGPIAFGFFFNGNANDCFTRADQFSYMNKANDISYDNRPSYVSPTGNGLKGIIEENYRVSGFGGNGNIEHVLKTSYAIVTMVAVEDLDPKNLPII